jgi:TonB-dependent SusC/RagA subfamily outer membrane receptor
MKTNLKKFLALSFMIMFQWGIAQTSVSGTVSDSSGVPLPGATVLVAGTSNGVSTDFDGVYSISASEGDVLSVSYVGFVTQNVTIGASATVNVTLVSDNALEEVVVTALGISRAKKSLGFAQQTVSGETLSESKQVDLNVALTGKIAGVQMIGGSSSTFDNGFLRLRGESDVLYVVDGIKVYTMSDINTDNIASISVLKGAAATALYGADAKSGVIVISSKKAKKGESSFTVDHSTSVSSVSILPNYQNEYGGGYDQEWDLFNYNPATDPSSWAAFQGQNIPYYGADESWGPKLDGTLARHWDSWIPNHPNFGELRAWSPNPNNVKNFYESGIENSTSIAFATGTDNSQVRGSLRLINETLPFPNTARNQIDASVNGSVQISDNLSAFSSINYQIRKTENFPVNGYGGLGANFNQWFQRQIDMDRMRDNYFFEGKYYTWNRVSARNATPKYWDSASFDF